MLSKECIILSMQCISLCLKCSGEVDNFKCVRNKTICIKTSYFETIHHVFMWEFYHIVFLSVNGTLLSVEC